MRTISDMFRYMVLDYRRVVRMECVRPVMVFFFQGFWAVVNYRFSRFVFLNVKIPVIRQLLLVFAYLWRKLVEITASVYLPWRADIGPGLHIAHFGPTLVSPESCIGANCNLSQGVTIGMTLAGKYPGSPQVGNRVYFGANSIAVGGITIGDDAAIGAGAVVTKPVPPRAVVVGNPARIISYNGSFHYIVYDGMEKDPDRIAAWEACQTCQEDQQEPSTPTGQPAEAGIA